MKRFLKRIGVFALAALCVAGVVAGSTTTAYATDGTYNFATHEVSTGTVYMDMQHGYDVNVSLYVLTQNNANYLSYEYPYKFSCYSHLPEEYESEFGKTFGYMTLSYNGEEIEALGDNMIYRYTWNMMDGEYSFSWPESNGDLSALTSTFEAPFIDPEYGTFYTMDDAVNGNYEVVTVGSDDHVRIYAMLGEFKWRQQVAPEFIEWAKAYDTVYEQGDGSGVEPSETPDPAPETSTEPTLSFGTVEEENSMEANEPTEPKPEKEDVEVVIPPSEENTSSGIAIPFLVGAIALLFIIILVVRRKKKDE